MGIEQRKHQRYDVRLAVRYANAEEFVTDYVENLSVGGLYIAGAHQLQLLTETDVQIELPGQGAWTVRGKVAFLIDPQAAKLAGREPGAGIEILTKPPGFDDALLGYLLRLGRRRDHVIMIAEGMIGANLFVEAGYRVQPLESEDEVAFALSDSTAAIIAIVLPPSLVTTYRDRLGEAGKAIVFSVSTIEDVHDILARIDSLL